jgi:hypothetical protein
MASKLRALPPVDVSKRRANKQGAIRYLADDIAALQERGYTMEEVTEQLTGLGLDISTPTLKSYLQRAKDGSAKPSKARRRRRAALRGAATEMQSVARADKPGAASSDPPRAVTTPATPDTAPKLTSGSSSLHAETASTVTRALATAEATTRAATPPIGTRALPPPGPRIDPSKADVPPVHGSVSVVAHDRKDASAGSDKSRP